MPPSTPNRRADVQRFETPGSVQRETRSLSRTGELMVVDPLAEAALRVKRIEIRFTRIERYA